MLQPEGCFYWQMADPEQECALNFFCASNDMTYRNFFGDGFIIGNNGRTNPYTKYTDAKFEVYPDGEHLDIKNLYIVFKKKGHQRMLARPFNALYLAPGTYDEEKIPENMKLAHVLPKVLAAAKQKADANKYIIGGP